MEMAFVEHLYFEIAKGNYFPSANIKTKRNTYETLFTNRHHVPNREIKSIVKGFIPIRRRIIVKFCIVIQVEAVPRIQYNRAIAQAIVRTQTKINSNIKAVVLNVTIVDKIHGIGLAVIVPYFDDVLAVEGIAEVWSCKKAETG